MPEASESTEGAHRCLCSWNGTWERVPSLENFDSPLTGQELGAGEHAGKGPEGMLGDGVGGCARRGPGGGVCWERVGGKLGESEGHAGRQ